MPMLQQTTGEVRLADYKRCHQWAGVAVLNGNSHKFLANTATHRPQNCLGGQSELLSPHKPEFIWGMSG